MPTIPRPALLVCAAAAVIALAFGGKSLSQQRPQGSSASAAAPYQQGTSEAGPPASGLVERGDQRTVVHVAGAVRRPGVYTLKNGARVRDAVRRAGGVSSRGDANAINLAAKVADGAQVIVPLKASEAVAAAGPSGSAAATPSAPISLGNATAEQLDTLDGVGPATAEKIIQWRTEYGGFTSVDDLGEVPGIGPKKLEALRSQVTP